MRPDPGRYNLLSMTTRTPARRPEASRHPAQGTQLMPIKGSLELRKRLKIAAAEDGLTYAEMIWALLDIRDDRRARQRRMQRSPLHRVPEPVIEL
ncbi:hypothetical protein SEA_DONNY_68 [Mycobacterium phage Donny]|uniref:Ribbon-helix-helix DNA binding domain protein n=3 Tax=Acadianvirus acadian TaxID=1982901 RepID=A0A7M1CQG6_9CAUD|nr:hypothetical protein CM14_gp67 [Mycobacterium phage Acadian]AER48980.1 hypothetical protein ACADIAN_67 [Mycobacterium phage Acadian]QBI96426.1 hypothetical protein SEA_DONNY_68 [Mycobacterium phage Donny]QOP65609.1 ribbon-helix-helix DNA binding domain protein [Mycobacterium phage Suigeneris]